MLRNAHAEFGGRLPGKGPVYRDLAGQPTLRGAVPADGDQPMIGGARPGGRLATGAHWRIEEYLKASGLAWSVLRPSGFMQNFLTGAGALTIDGKLVDGYGGAAVAYIDCYDTAACAVALLTGPSRPA